ncbi:uncharacterized protein B0H18DRAFT_1042941 [Fomitopsis serialis]|uniref:uncharacterized protein n=1 Tax=Fomitopsis serialis TaxID=139415 RepID=UPI002007669A|nr:uncharacterized protein B0H18DRAFT_1042941 [Neoantrodia serialis]KAH9915094.1 hypothetical protein B0H18DRAFT_1042941 [Neoantrodia serialis]
MLICADAGSQRPSVAAPGTRICSDERNGQAAFRCVVAVRASCNGAQRTRLSLLATDFGEGQRQDLCIETKRRGSGPLRAGRRGSKWRTNWDTRSRSSPRTRPRCATTGSASSRFVRLDGPRLWPRACSPSSRGPSSSPSTSIPSFHLASPSRLSLAWTRKQHSNQHRLVVAAEVVEEEASEVGAEEGRVGGAAVAVLRLGQVKVERVKSRTERSKRPRRSSRSSRRRRFRLLKRLRAAQQRKSPLRVSADAEGAEDDAGIGVGDVEGAGAGALHLPKTAILSQAKVNRPKGRGRLALLVRRGNDLQGHT